MHSAGRLTYALLVALVASSAYAMDAGPGTVTCFQFATAYQQDQTSEHRFFVWAEGYMSALSASRPDNASVDLDPDAFDHTDQLDFMLSYCAANPSKTYGSGVERLYEQIHRFNH